MSADDAAMSVMSVIATIEDAFAAAGPTSGATANPTATKTASSKRITRLKHMV